MKIERRGLTRAESQCIVIGKAKSMFQAECLSALFSLVNAPSVNRKDRKAVREERKEHTQESLHV
jgi:hypothetical protein